MAASNIKLPRRLPLLVIDGVLFPGASIRIPVSSSRNMSMVKHHLLSHSTLSSAIIGVVPKEDDSASEEDTWSMHHMGTAGIVVQVTGTNWPRPSYTLLVTGLCRFRLESLVQETPYLVGNVSQLDHLPGEDTVQSLPDICAAIVRASHAERLQVLDAVNLGERFTQTLPLLIRQIQGLQLLQQAKKDGSVTRTFRMEKVLPLPRSRQQLDIDDDDFEEGDDVALLEKKIKAAEMPDHARKVAAKELQRLKKMPPHMPEHAMTRNYIELLTDLPWAKCSAELTDLKKSRADLDADHYGMEKLKKRVLEYLAVRKLKSSLKGPILCFVGPPGVGKTSVGRSIARSLGREFYRISLGGVSDQADIRGHRRTYIGSMPGRIIQGLRTVGVKNPVFLLDEIDKMTPGIHGDPAAALLEVLDPEQNCAFIDHYLNIPYDLSDVLFIATANTISTVPPALLDRMEVISVPGYTYEEKDHITKHHLLPKQMREHGLSNSMMTVSDEAIRKLIVSYTREAGVRSLERKIGALCRAVAVEIVEHKGTESHLTVPGSKSQDLCTVDNAVMAGHPPSLPLNVDEMAVEAILGPPLYDLEMDARLLQPGVAVGLAWTIAGGEIMFVEASRMEGDGRLVLTGQLGDVMKESAKLALNWLRINAEHFDIPVQHGTDLMEGTDVHIHFPAGAVGKDGPSAGVTIVTVLVSLFTKRIVLPDIAMTGEITLQGLVLPVGGIKDKVLAAHRAGMRKVILPKRNKKDLLEVPDSIKNDLTFHLVMHVGEVLQVAFEGGFPNLPASAELASKL
ncbi:lon protease homolog 2, peroxisomal-like isoform X2 [Ornithodoros turicata]|uniref:lon protease homolog 2, peroxisomal-like isoform X2 n=1 Tax=Ornithodoros turicata TaxID=34597 RepID=UPI0031388E0F